MTQDINNASHYIAEEGMVFKRVHNGFTSIEKPMIVGKELYLGEIIVDANGKKLKEPIADSIEYYVEVEKPVRKRHTRTTEFVDQAQYPVEPEVNEEGELEPKIEVLIKE